MTKHGNLNGYHMDFFGSRSADLHVDIAKPLGLELASFGQRSNDGAVGLS